MNERIKNIVHRNENDKLVINCLDLEFLFSGMIKKARQKRKLILFVKEYMKH